MRLRLILLILLLGGIAYSALPKPEGSASLVSLDVDMWTSEFSDFCKSVRSVRDEQYDPAWTALSGALDRSACSRVAGDDPMRNAFPPKAPQPIFAPEPEAEPDVVAPAASNDAVDSTPIVRNPPTFVQGPEHMRAACSRMFEKMDDPTLTDEQWKDLNRSYVNLCMQ